VVVMEGRWIVFEGLAGAGTTTQVKRLVARLLDEGGLPGNRVVQTAEPTHGPLGEICRSALRCDVSLDPVSMALTFSADRSDHLFRPNGVLETKNRGGWIVMDRYLYSTLAYQDCGPPRDWLLSVNSVFPRPDLVVFLKTPVEICLERLSERGKESDLFEEEETLRRIARSYEWVFEVESGKTEVLEIDGRLPETEISDRVFQRITKWIPG